MNERFPLLMELAGSFLPRTGNQWKHSYQDPSRSDGLDDPRIWAWESYMI